MNDFLQPPLPDLEKGKRQLKEKYQPPSFRRKKLFTCLRMSPSSHQLNFTKMDRENIGLYLIKSGILRRESV